MKKLYLFAIIAGSILHAHTQPCSDLFFSEYVEGSSNNKAIEIYNPTSTTISLTGYKVELLTNGSLTPTFELNLAGTIAPGDVYVIVNSLASPAIKATRDTSSNITNFNGDDALALAYGTNIIDVIGLIGEDPGTSWPVDTGSTLNHTLVRKPSINQSNAIWATVAGEWLVYSQDVFFLGSHTMTPCGAQVDTLASFVPAAATVSEGAGSYNLTLALNHPFASAKTIDVQLKSGDVADIGGFTTQTVTFPSNIIQQTVNITITNDLLAEANEQLVFRLANPASGMVIGSDSLFTLTITDNDVQPWPQYDIATVTTINAIGNTDSNGVHCIVSGVVYGVNLRATGMQFTIADATGGMGVFDPAENFGYTIQEGDSIVVSGKVGQYSGLTQMQYLDTVYKVGAGTLVQPLVTTVLDETTESELVRINNVYLANISQWDNSNLSGFSVDLTDGTNTYIMRIDEQVDLFGLLPPTTSFDLIGIGSQFDTLAAYLTDYNIFPRSSADFILHTGIVETQLKNNLNVYPNPSAGIFYVLNPQLTDGGSWLKVSDITGKIIFKKPCDAGTFTTLELSATEPGFYFIHLYSRTGVSTGKVQIISGR